MSTSSAVAALPHTADSAVPVTRLDYASTIAFGRDFAIDDDVLDSALDGHVYVAGEQVQLAPAYDGTSALYLRCEAWALEGGAPLRAWHYRRISSSGESVRGVLATPCDWSHAHTIYHLKEADKHAARTGHDALIVRARREQWTEERRDADLERHDAYYAGTPVFELHDDPTR